MHRSVAIVLALGIGACSTTTSEPAGANSGVFMVGGPGAPPPAGMAGFEAPPPPSMADPSAQPPAQPPPSNDTPQVTPPGMDAVPPTIEPPPPSGPKLAMDECGLDTIYPGDEYCINAPPAAEGFQMHIGPSNYDRPEAQFLLQPGREVTENINAVSGNTSQIYYYWRQYRMRPGSHHLIITNNGRRLGGSSNAAKDNPEAGVIAPENQGVGMPLSARAQLSNSLHYFNFTDQPIIKEVWVNFWYRDRNDVTEPTREVFSMLGMGIAPGQHVNKRGACRISSPGRFLTVYGHVHANNERFSVWRVRGGERLLIHEAYDWEHPGISEFSSTVMNPPLNPAARADGGFSGIVDLVAGDTVEFECQIINNTGRTFLGLNEAEDDEMCILIGDTVGTSIPGQCTSTTTPVL
jgi:hypothetical protein